MNLSKITSRNSRFLDIPLVTYIGFGFWNWHIGVLHFASGIWQNKILDWLSVTNTLIYTKQWIGSVF